MKESTLRDKLVKALKPLCHVVKVENGAGGDALGTPDLYICYRGFSAWVELKCLDVHNSTDDIGKKNQASWKREKLWMMKHVENGGNCFVLCYCKRDHDYYLYEVDGSPEGWLKELRLDRISNRVNDIICQILYLIKHDG